MSAAQSVSIGHFWFKYRSFSPLPALVAVFVFPPNFTPSNLAFVVLWVGILLAECLRLWAVGYAGSITRTRSANVTQLVHAGPYRWVRNPLYIANIVMYCLVAVAFGFSYLTAAIFLYFFIQYTYIIQFEESALRAEFGEAFEKYLQVPRWFPNGSIYPRSEHHFSLSKAIRSERTTWVALAVIFILCIIRGRLINI